MSTIQIDNTANEDSSARLTAMENLVDCIIGSLEDAGIPYCLLRNRDAIPTGLLSWSDLDIMIPDWVTFSQLNQVFAHLTPANIVHIRQGRPAYFFPVDDLFLRVDIFNGDVEWRGVPFADHKDILANRVDDDGIWVASPIHQAIIVWFSKLLWSNRFPTRYERLIEDAILADPDAFTKRLSDAFGASLAHEFVTLGLEHNLSASEAQISRCKKALWMRALRRHPLKVIKSFAKQIQNGIQQRIHPTGLKVVILGPDGAGKTSICSHIQNAPSRNIPFGHVKYRLLYHRLLPPLSSIESRIRRKPIQRSINPHNPHGNTPHQPVTWLLKFSYYTIDQWLSEVLWTRTQLAHTDLILLDRHLMELSIDARRYRYAGPRLLARLFARLTPKPDLLLVLDAPPEIIQARKQDVTFGETLRQRQAYRDLAESYPNARIIDASQPLEDVLKDVRTVLAAFTSDRTGKRYGFTYQPFAPKLKALSRIDSDEFIEKAAKS